jgi:hypothetical protein
MIGDFLRPAVLMSFNTAASPTAFLRRLLITSLCVSQSPKKFDFLRILFYHGPSSVTIVQKKYTYVKYVRIIMSFSSFSSPVMSFACSGG